MFGMGFMEILLIAVIAIIALGPDKLPTAMVEIAKFIKKFKTGVDDAKSTLDSELNISEMREEANKFKAQIEDTKSSFKVDTKVDLGLDKIMNEDDSEDKSEKKKKKKKEKVSFKKEQKEEIQEAQILNEEKTQEQIIEEKNQELMNAAANKFKVSFDDDKKEEKN